MKWTAAISIVLSLTLSAVFLIDNQIQSQVTEQYQVAQTLKQGPMPLASLVWQDIMQVTGYVLELVHKMMLILLH